MLEPKRIVTRQRVARRVLRLAVGIVSNAALYGIVIWSIGCIIPTPLDRAPQPTNYSPVFVTSSINPPFGPVTLPIRSLSTLALAATDPNPDDTLVVHLFEPDLTTPGSFTLVDATGATLARPTTPDNEDPNLRIGAIDSGVCLNAADQTKFDLYAIVADRSFNAPSNNPTHADGGLTDANHWEVTCSSM